MSGADQSRFDAVEWRAGEQGMAIQRSPETDPNTAGFGRYCLVMRDTGEVVVHDERTGAPYVLTLEDVEQILAGVEANDDDEEATVTAEEVAEQGGIFPPGSAQPQVPREDGP